MYGDTSYSGHGAMHKERESRTKGEQEACPSLNAKYQKLGRQGGGRAGRSRHKNQHL